MLRLSLTGTGGPKLISKPLQYIGYVVLFVVSFLFFVYLTFPFNILKESLVMKLNAATGLNISVHNLSPSLLLGMEAQGVRLKAPTGQEVNFAAIEVSLSTWPLLVGRLRGVLEVQDAQKNPLEVAAGFGLFTLIADATSGRQPLPDKITVKAKNYGLNDLTAFALSSYASQPGINPLVAPLLEQMEVRGRLNADIALALDLEDPTASDGSLNLSIDEFALAMNAPDFTIDDQIFEKALIKASLSGGSLKIQEGSEFSSQDISMRVSGDLLLKTPLPSSVMNLSIPVQIKGALKSQFGFLIEAMLKGTSDGNIPLQVRGTLLRPSVSYN